MSSSSSPSSPSKSASRGSYYKGRSKKWLQHLNYQVADMEIYHRVGPTFGVKQDQFGSDLLAMDGTELIFVQVKGGKNCRGNMAAARRLFDEFEFPNGVKRWLMMWPLRARHPQIVESTERGVWKEL